MGMDDLLVADAPAETGIGAAVGAINVNRISSTLGAVKLNKCFWKGVYENDLKKDNFRTFSSERPCCMCSGYSLSCVYNPTKYGL